MQRKVMTGVSGQFGPRSDNRPRGRARHERQISEQWPQAISNDDLERYIMVVDGSTLLVQETGHIAAIGQNSTTHCSYGVQDSVYPGGVPESVSHHGTVPKTVGVLWRGKAEKLYGNNGRSHTSFFIPGSWKVPVFLCGSGELTCLARLFRLLAITKKLQSTQRDF
ncbi:uncharacterized [Tachysurus ichikawai]